MRNDFEKNLRAAAARWPAQFRAALYRAALRVDADMIERIPVDTGRLRGSHYVAPPEHLGGSLVCEVGVGTDYAVDVHEKTWIPHSNGEAKYLEKALKSVKVAEHITADMQAQVESGRTRGQNGGAPKAPKV